MRRQRLDLQGKRIVLTGASSGIGRALAAALAHRGANLVLAARRQGLLDDLAGEITDGGHARPVAVPTDLSVPGAAADLGRRALDASAASSTS